MDKSLGRSCLTAGGEIDGVVLKPLEAHHDSRGTFTEVFQAYWETLPTPCQWSVVASEANVFRGCHLHRAHDEYFCLLQGRAYVGLKDERPGSRTHGNWQLYDLSGDEVSALMFPAGLVHGWYFPDRALHLQGVTESYRDYASYDNWGIHWSDPELGIPWPFDDPVLSERAEGFVSLNDYRRTLTDVAAEKS